MLLLTLGLLLFCSVHLAIALAPQRFAALRDRYGANAVKGMVALGVLLGLVLVVLGWRSASPQWLYSPPGALRLPAIGVLAIAIWLFVVSQRPSAVRRFVRHPQLTGVLLWCLAHLLLNGDSRSLLLFGTLAAWSVLEIVAINRRDGSYSPPAAPALAVDLKNVVAAAVFFAFLAWIHPWIAGVRVLPA